MLSFLPCPILAIGCSRLGSSWAPAHPSDDHQDEVRRIINADSSFNQRNVCNQSIIAEREREREKD